MISTVFDTCFPQNLLLLLYENIKNVKLYIPQNKDINDFIELHIKHIIPSDKHIGSYNYFCPQTRILLHENNLKLNIKREYSFGTNINSYKNAFQLITLIPPDSGPGNQIIGIKECLILSLLLDRIIVIPPIREHYLKSNTIFYNFNEIFNLNLSNIIIDNNKSILNDIDFNKKCLDKKCVNKKKYVINSNYLNVVLRHETIIDNNDTYNEILLNKRILNSPESLNELKNISDNLIIIKHLFNNVKISKCGINGCFTCELNSNFKDLYQKICSRWDFSDNIKNIGQQYIESNFASSLIDASKTDTEVIENRCKNMDFIACHIRLPDIMSKEIEHYTCNLYNSEKLLEIISKLKSQHKKPLFICSNNILYLKKIGIDAYFYNIPQKHDSFIEQYICCKSDIFYYLNLENTRFMNEHNRSTWSSFVIDYRVFFTKSNNNFNLLNN